MKHIKVTGISEFDYTLYPRPYRLCIHGGHEL
jgi:hypothetical protein